MNRLNSLSFLCMLVLAGGLSGCGATLKKAEYPSTWPSRVTNSARADCANISGTFKANNDQPSLPFFLFGIPDTTSIEWANLVQINEQLLDDPDGATVTIGYPDSDHIDVVVTMHGMPIAKQVLARSSQGANAAVWVGQSEQSFRCEPDGVVIVGAYIHNWGEYSLPYSEKKRRYRRPGQNDVGTSRGYFHFSKAANGSLVMREQRYFCLGCGGLDELWRRWESVRGATEK